MRYSSFCLVLAGIMAVCVTALPKVPLMPEEFSAFIFQEKWNHFGDILMNHTCAGAMYQSYKRHMMREDCAAHHPVTSDEASLFTSVQDFSHPGMLINTIVERVNVSGPETCQQFIMGPEDGFPAPWNATFLSDVHATYGGHEWLPGIGNADRWTWFRKPDSIFTFVFDGAGSLVRVDTVATFWETGTRTTFMNMAVGGPLPDVLFTGLKCPDQPAPPPPINVSSSSTGASTGFGPTPRPKDDGLSTNAIVGISVGGSVGLLSIAAFSLWYYKRHRPTGTAATGTSSPYSPTMSSTLSTPGVGLVASLRGGARGVDPEPTNTTAYQQLQA